jgi:hypothetical protein
VNGDETTDGYLSLDDYHLSIASTSMRIAVERELMRHSWLDREGYVPAGLYGAVPPRLVASAMDGVLGDWTEAFARLDRETVRWLSELLSRPPARSLDWLMRALAICMNEEESREWKAASTVPRAGSGGHSGGLDPGPVNAPRARHRPRKDPSGHGDSPTPAKRRKVAVPGPPVGTPEPGDGGSLP